MKLKPNDVVLAGRLLLQSVVDLRFGDEFERDGCNQPITRESEYNRDNRVHYHRNAAEGCAAGPNLSELPRIRIWADSGSGSESEPEPDPHPGGGQ